MKPANRLRRCFSTPIIQGLREIIRQQSAAGVDIAGDGELPRIGFSMYVKDRVGGSGGSASRGTVTDFAKFPEYAILMAKRMGLDPSKSASVVPTPECIGAVVYDPKRARATEELDLFAAALASEKASVAKLTETFVAAGRRASFRRHCCRTRRIRSITLTPSMCSRLPMR